jgi:hypothetical protein
MTLRSNGYHIQMLAAATGSRHRRTARSVDNVDPRISRNRRSRKNLCGELTFYELCVPFDCPAQCITFNRNASSYTF